MTVKGLSLEHIARQNAELKVLLSTIDVKLEEGSKARQAADSAAASVRILEKKNLVLKNENSRLFRKIDDLGNLIEEQAARIEELEEGQTGPQLPNMMKALEDTRAENRRLLGENTIIKRLEARIKELEGGDFPHYAYEKEIEGLKEKIEHERSVNADLKEAQQAAAKKVLLVEQDNARLRSELADAKRESNRYKQERDIFVKEDEHIKELLGKMGFQYISAWPVTK